MAVDGVAPRAKINQQRGRRFRAAKDAELQESKARAKGEEIPKEARFDSNCITPGTVFMSKLNEQLKYFITYKISTDKLWQKCKIILSGSEVPGEGEHKIMDYIRYMKAQPGYEGNTRHCLYGLDADLIMLGLCSHEPHFSLLREEVKFGKAQKKILTPEETNFCLLHLSLMREYLELEFSPIKDELPFDFDVEKIIDDWVLMGFLVGNDFIPHLPNLHIENNALPILYNAYMEVLPTLNGYINESGLLNLERFEKFMDKLGHYDIEQFDEIYADLKLFESKTGRRLNENDKSSKNSPVEVASPNKTINKALNALIIATESELGETDEEVTEEDSEDDDIHLEFVQHKRDYYMRKMEYEDVDAEIMKSQAEGYIRAIQWNLHYYYNGCCSWSWYYPHHYAPFISDIKNFKNLKLEFDLGTPFLPFQQLLAVLPAASKDLLPVAYHGLMTEENSPIINYYPIDFKTDLNGKKQEWEAVVLIPLIDENSLLNAMNPCNAKLLPEEIKRNQHGPMSVFTFTETEQGIYEAPEYFPKIISHANMELIEREKILVPRDKLVKGLCKGVKLGVYYPGFPTLQHIPHTSSLVKAKVKVFEQASRRENMILTVLPKKTPSIEDIAKKLLGKTVFINWPHLIEALVVGVSNTTQKISIAYPLPKQSDGKTNAEVKDDVPIAAWNLQMKNIVENYKTRLGIDVGDVDVLIHACPMVGRQYVYSAAGKMTLEKQWNEISMTFAYQVIVYDIAVQNPEFIQFTSISDIFKPKSICFMLGHPHYGAMGEVTEPGVDLKTTRVKVAMRVTPEPNFDRVKQLQKDSRQRYMPGNIAAQRLGISSHLLSRITGTIFVINENGGDPSNANKHNLGLNLKFNKKNEEVQGFTRKDNNGVWLYSVKAIEYVKNYMKNFPEMFLRLESNFLFADMFLKSDLFPENSSESMEAVVSWLKEQSKALNLQTRVCGTEILESDVVKSLEQEVDRSQDSIKEAAKTTLMQVKPHLLFKPSLNSGNMPPDSKAQHRLLDRIVCVRESFTVPLGYKGTITGIQKGENVLLNMYEVLFDKPFAGGLVIHDCSPNRSYRLAAMDFINISYGIQIENKNNVSKVNIATPSWRQPQQSQQQQKQQPKQQQLYQPPVFRSPLKQQLPPQIQPPDPATLSSFYPTFNKNEQSKRPQQQQQQQQQPTRTNKSSSSESPSHIKREQMQQRQQYPTVPNVLQRFAENNKAVPSVQNTQQPTKTQGPSEYQALWNELNKIPQKPMEMPQIPFSVKDKSNPATPLTSASKTSPQDPSEFLKAMLKISDDSSKINKPTSSSSSSTGPTPSAKKPIAFPQMPPQMPAQMSGQMPAQMPAQMPGQMPAQMPQQMPQQMPAQIPALMDLQIPALMQTQMPAQMQTQMPAQMQTQMQTQMSAQVQTQMPAQMQTQMPAQMQTQMPLQMQTQMPLQMQSQMPLQMQTQMQSITQIHTQSQVQASKVTDTPPLVQQLFDHARQAEKQTGKNIWYCSQLLTHFQHLGVGFPRYTYFTNKDNLTCSQITLPDLRVFCGDFCKTTGEAAENTAKKVYEELKLDQVAHLNVRSSPMRAAPQQQPWFNMNRVAVQTNVRQQPPPPPTSVKPMLPAAFPQAPLMQMPPMPKWSPMPQQNPPGFNTQQNPPGFNTQQNPPGFNTQQNPPGFNTQQLQQGRFPQPPLVCNRQEQPQQQQHQHQHQQQQQQQPKKPPTSFVPLQAQKKTRNVSNKQGTDHKLQMNKNLDNKADTKSQESLPEEVKQDISNVNKAEKSISENNQSQTVQKNQKTARQRRSRVAAKFISDPLANGGDRQ